MANQTGSVPDRGRAAGVVLAATGLGIVALFLLHPADHATDFAGFVQDEAAHQAMDVVVHGGFILLLSIQLACYAIFCGRLGWKFSVVTTGLVFFAFGAVLQTGSIFTDGLLTPALAARYVAAPADRLAGLRALFTLCDVVSSWLGPLGMLFEAIGITAWGAALYRNTRVGGIATGLLGLAMVAVLAASAVLGPGFGILAIFGLVGWALIAGLMMIRRLV